MKNITILSSSLVNVDLSNSKEKSSFHVWCFIDSGHGSVKAKLTRIALKDMPGLRYLSAFFTLRICCRIKYD